MSIFIYLINIFIPPSRRSRGSLKGYYTGFKVASSLVTRGWFGWFYCV